MKDKASVRRVQRSITHKIDSLSECIEKINDSSLDQKAKHDLSKRLGATQKTLLNSLDMMTHVRVIIGKYDGVVTDEEKEKMLKEDDLFKHIQHLKKQIRKRRKGVDG